MDTVLERLNNVSDVELLSKTKRGVKDNTIRCLLALKGNSGLIKEIYDLQKFTSSAGEKLSTVLEAIFLRLPWKDQNVMLQ